MSTVLIIILSAIFLFILTFVIAINSNEGKSHEQMNLESYFGIKQEKEKVNLFIKFFKLIKDVWTSIILLISAMFIIPLLLLGMFKEFIFRF